MLASVNDLYLIAEGREQGITQIALKMMSKGKSIEEIQEITDLAYEKIVNLREITKHF